MKISHTKGPWSVGRDSEFRNQTAIDPSIGCAYGLGEEVKANARLMAAAPDLLVVAQVIAADSRWTSGEPLLMQLCAAIAKATGEPQ